MPRRWYQTLEIDNVVFEDEKRKDSMYWNEGKWNNFIAPLLPKECQTFLEIGTNAGLFLKMATDIGFINVTGVEGNSRIMAQAREYKTSIDGEYKLAHELVGHNLNLQNFPLADVVLIANTHYYFPVGVFSRLVDELRNRCLYCIVVSAKAKRRQGNALYDLESVRGYFRDWKEAELTVYNLDSNDPCPREQMFGVLFKGNLTTIDVDNYYDDWYEAAKIPGHRSHELASALQDFTHEILKNGRYAEIKDTELYKYWTLRMSNKSLDWIANTMYDKRDLILSIQEDGIKEPIYLDNKFKLLDGLHRLCVAKALDYDHILARIL